MNVRSKHVLRSARWPESLVDSRCLGMHVLTILVCLSPVTFFVRMSDFLTTRGAHPLAGCNSLCFWNTLLGTRQSENAGVIDENRATSKVNDRDTTFEEIDSYTIY